MGILTTSTTSRGVCPQPGADRCPDFCESVQICASLERGECLYEQGLDNMGTAVQRNIFVLTLRIQNCLECDLGLLRAALYLTPYLLSVDADGQETVVTGFGNATSTVASETGVFKVINYVGTCGVLNENFTGGFGPPSPTSANLFTGRTILPPGECCLKLTFVVDVIENPISETFNSILLESACVRLLGGSVAGANTCCPWQRDLLLPSDCQLRYLRNTLPPIVP